MSSITIYQSVTDLNDPKLEKLVSECQDIITRGQNARVDMCMNMAEQQEHIQNNYKKKDRKALQASIADYFGIQLTTYHKYSKAGQYYLSNPEQRHLSMDAVMKTPKQIAAPRPQRINHRLEAEALRKECEQLRASCQRMQDFEMFMQEKMGQKNWDIFQTQFLKSKNWDATSSSR